MSTLQRQLLVILGLATLFGAMPLSAQINPELAREAMNFDHWLAFEPDEALARVQKAIEEHPADPATAALLKMNRWALEYAQDSNAIGETILTTSDNGEKLEVFGPNAREFASMAISAARGLGKYELARKITDRMFGVRQWRVAGPFASRYEGDQHHRILPPELYFDPKATYEGEFRPISWEEWKATDPSDDQISLANNVKRTGPGWFAWTELESEKDQKVLFDFDVVSGGVKAWLDGKMIFHRRSFADASRDDVALATLSKGKHSLVIKFGASTSAIVSISDPMTRLPLANVKESLPSLESSAFQLGGEVKASANPHRFATQPFEAWLAKNPEEKSEVRALTALLQLAAGEEEEALKHWHLAKAWREAQSPNAQAANFLYHEDSSIIETEGKRNSARRKTLNWIKEKVKGEVHASIKLAQMDASESRHRQAVDALSALLKRKDHWAIRLKLADIYSNEGWGAEARDERLRAIALAKKLDAGLPVSLLRLWQDIAESDEDQDLTETLQRRLEASKARGQYSTVMTRLAIARSKGFDELENRAAAEKVLRALKAMSGYETNQCLRTRVEMAEAQGQIDKARQYLIEIRDRSLRDRAWAMNEIGSLLLRHDRIASAAEVFHEVLEFEPSNQQARQALEKIRGEHLRIKHEYNSEVTHEMLELLQPEAFPKASAGYLLDEEVWIVHDDGSYHSFAQKVIKILRQDGVDRFGRQNPQGTVTKVRTMLADGGESEPATVRGNAFEFPNVAPGNALHWIARDDHRSSEHHVLEDVVYNFSERDMSIPSAIVRLVVVINAKTPLYFRKSNMEDVTFSETQDEQGRRVLTWELRNPQSKEAERFMPSVDQFRPVLEFSRDENGWSDEIEQVRRRVDELPKRSWLIEEKTSEVLQAFKGMRFETSKAMHLAKAEVFYNWINKTIKVEGFNSHPHLTLVEKSGDRADLFRAMLHAAGVPFEEVFVLNRADGLLDSPFFATGSFYRQYFRISGDTYVDLSNRQAPFGECDYQDRSARAASVDPESGRVTLFFMPATIGTQKPSKLELYVAFEQDLKETVVIGKLVQGRQGWEAREADRDASESEREQSFINELVADAPGLVIDEAWYHDTEALGRDYQRDFTGHIEESVKPDDQGTFQVTPMMEKTSELLGGYIRTESRNYDLLLRSSYYREIKTVYDIPKGYALKALPEDSALLAAPFTYRLTYEIDGKRVIIKRTLRLQSRRIAAANYKSFKAQIESIGKAEDQKLVFIKKKD